MRRTHSEPTLPIPNPDDWLGYAAVMRILGIRSHATVGRMVTDGRLRAHAIDGAAAALFWRADVLELATARARAKGRADG